MKLLSATVGPFRSITQPQSVEIDPSVTVLVGMNEAGKTVFLKALHKAHDALNKEKYDPLVDYPRKDFFAYQKKDPNKPDTAVCLTYALSDQEISEINSALNTEISTDFTLEMHYRYDNTLTIGIDIDETPVIEAMIKNNNLDYQAIEILEKSTSVRDALEGLEKIPLRSADEEEIINKIKASIEKAKNLSGWHCITALEVWLIISSKVPHFLYFSDYDLLPGKINLNDLKRRQAATLSSNANEPNQLEPRHQAVLALLRMAKIKIDDFFGNAGYDHLKSQIESCSIDLTDRVLEFWNQNKDIEIEVDIRADSLDSPPYNDGPNLYLRIKNKRHRGVSTSFDQRSRGFIWFFSFLVWFDSIQEQIGPLGNSSERKKILLLDEPALALHALAQKDFLNYIDKLSENHQVIYTTHSPFMVHADRLHQVRIVEDKGDKGTSISNNLSGSDPRAVFPLQAALGWNIAQNLFIAKNNLLVEGVSELVLLQAMSKIIEDSGKKGLSNNITIVPAGGLNNIATFVSLLGSNGLNFAVFHDYDGKPEQKFESLIKSKVLSKKSVLNVSQFRNPEAAGQTSIASDLEDLITPTLYLEYFNKVFAKELNGTTIKTEDLPPGDRIVHQIQAFLSNKKISLRQSPGYNHYAVALAIATTPPPVVPEDTIIRFSELFKAINIVLKQEKI